MRFRTLRLAAATALCMAGLAALAQGPAGAAGPGGHARSTVGRQSTVAAPGTTPTTLDTPFTGGSVVSEPGDYIGGGQSYPDLTVTGTGLYGGYPTYDMSNGTDGFHVVITPPAGQRFVAGTTYSDVQRSEFRPAGFPGLDVSGGDRGCNQVVGSFTVYDAGYSSDGILDYFAVQFFQHCEGDYAALMGNLSYFSDVALPPLPATAPEPPQEAQFVSQPGDYLGQGLDQTFPIAYPFGDPNRQNAARWEIATTSAQNDFEVDLAGPHEAPLALGTYDDVDRCSGGSPDQPCMEVFGESRGCDAVSGTFTVYDISDDTLGMLQSFAAEFITHCEAGAPALYGAIRWNSTVAMPARFTTAKRATAAVGSPFSFTVETSGLPVPSLTRTGRHAGLHFTDNGDGTATLSGTPKKTGRYTMHFRAVVTSGTQTLVTKQKFTLVVSPAST